MTADTRPPLRFPSEAQALDYFRTHGEDVGRTYVVTGFTVVSALNHPWPPREALGWNAAGAWVWLDKQGKPKGQWP